MRIMLGLSLFSLASHYLLFVKRQMIHGTTSGCNCTIWRNVILDGLVEADGGRFDGD